eukprot:1350083-Karenia_brevis.AAC.1
MALHMSAPMCRLVLLWNALRLLRSERIPNWTAVLLLVLSLWLARSGAAGAIAPWRLWSSSPV